ncbi:hypothetical protein VTK73DRAFT_7643 [Phialemonium thermophilum]|uniref:VPS37 C-terminal domain-containing protein n=1 Tax=Phialemonium thermophilum TaxID=223376 RepID=A0ABR3Y6D5_9PEZI
MYSYTPPRPPPKPDSHEASRKSTPASSTQSPPAPPLPDAGEIHGTSASASIGQSQVIPDPGEQWLPRFLEDKSKQDLATILSSPALLSALTHAPQTIHPSLRASHEHLARALVDNIDLANRLRDLEVRLASARASTQAQLLSTHALERAWRARQGDMDAALAPFYPGSLYQRLAMAVNEQEGVCRALEESFLDGGLAGGTAGADDAGLAGLASEREVMDWIRRYREAKKLYYLRRERKERWDEGRVGGWR